MSGIYFDIPTLLWVGYHASNANIDWSLIYIFRKSFDDNVYLSLLKICFITLILRFSSPSTIEN